MTDVALSPGARIAGPNEFFSVVTNGDFAITVSGGYVFLLGIMLLMADRLGTRLRRGTRAELPGCGLPSMDAQLKVRAERSSI
jgi:hypothetical protein